LKNKYEDSFSRPDSTKRIQLQEVPLRAAIDEEEIRLIPQNNEWHAHHHNEAFSTIGFSIFQTISWPSSVAEAKQDCPKGSMVQAAWLYAMLDSMTIRRFMVLADLIQIEPSKSPIKRTWVPEDSQEVVQAVWVIQELLRCGLYLECRGGRGLRQGSGRTNKVAVSKDVWISSQLFAQVSSYPLGHLWKIWEL
jgi:hypothetical protein